MSTQNKSQSAIYFGNEVVEPIEAWPISVNEPATGAVLGTLIGGGEKDALLAIHHANVALESWSARSVTARAAALQKIANALRDEPTAHDLAELISRETGKRLDEARSEVNLSAAFFDWFAIAIAGRHDQIWNIVPGLQHKVSHYPLGVIGVITPWNFPVSIPARKISAALAAGCTVIFKPSEIAPFSSLRLIEIVGSYLPANVICTVVGEPRGIVNALLSAPQVRGVSFTGSTAVGKIIAANFAAAMKRSVLELGGNAPYIVLDDADIDEAVATLLIAKYRNNGQSCIAANHAWVPSSKFDKFVESFTEASKALLLGNPLSATTTLGPLALPTDAIRIADLVNEAEDSGATVIRTNMAVPTVGYFSSPTICLSPPLSARIVNEEIFGPAISILPYDDLDSVINTVQNFRYGLSAYIATSDVMRAAKVARILDVGIVGINTATPNTPQILFGGRKSSGYGWEGGQLGLEEFLSHQSLAYPTY